MNTNSYFTVEANGNGTITLLYGGTATPVTLYYWKNVEPNSNRDNYTGTITAATSGTTGNSISYTSGDIIKFYRAETTAWAAASNITDVNYFNNSFTNTKIYGNLASLIGFNETLPTNAFVRLFYYCSFYDCSELELPWDSIPTWAFANMFYGSRVITKVPIFPATTVENEGYARMFRAIPNMKTLDMNKTFLCKNVTGSPYNQMFLDGRIEKVIVKTDYETVSGNGRINANLFAGTSYLNTVTCLAPEISQYGNEYHNWMSSHASDTGTFIKHPDATWPTGNSGIPSGWTVKNMNPQVKSLDFNDVNAVYVKGNIGISAIYGQNNQLLWSKNT